LLAQEDLAKLSTLPPAASMQPSRPPAERRQPAPGAADHSQLPTITLPKGGGAIRGIEEKFQANPATGTATFSVPLPVSPARQGFSPALALAYDSGAGNSAFGLGWDVPIPSISRKTERRLPEYRDEADSDVFQLTGAEDLVPMLAEDEDSGVWERVEDTPTVDGVDYDVRRYRPRREGAFTRIERWRRVSDGDVHWRTATGANVHAVYGRTPDARIADPRDARRVYRWLIQESYDDLGNHVRYEYRAENLDGVGPEMLHERNRVSGLAPVANRYLKAVHYGNVTPYRPSGPAPGDHLFQTVFDYGEHDADDPQPDDGGEWHLRHDPFSTCRPGFEVRTYRACRRVLLFHRFPSLGATPCLVRSMELLHDDRPGFKFLTGITVTGYIRDEEGAYSRKSLPPLSFTYQQPAWSREVHRVAPGDAVHAPAGLASPRYQWVDLYGEGIAGILAEERGGWYYKRNLGGGAFEPAHPVSPRPSFSGLADGTLAIADVDGDGRRAAVQLEGSTRGFFRAGDEGEWEPFRAFRRVPSRPATGPYARWIDLNGDGRPELVVDEDEAFAWYESEGADGFAPARRARKVFDEERGPRVVFADATQSIFLADFNGDGLVDVVRIRNGEIAYWPNEGYGRFGAKVTTTAAPRLDHPDRFNARLIRLADVDGSGTADLLYLGHDAIRVWSNLAGNAWSEAPVALDPFPPTALSDDVQVLDFLGTGTACVVWSSARPGEAAAPLRYVDLMGGRKPHVLSRYENNAGGRVDLHYRSSALFWLDDRRAGTPWATRLPFPVHCLHRVENRDLVRGSYFASEYAYHHGYFDHAEREFRGFGRVDQRDTETFDHFVHSGGTNVVEAPLHQPPVLTRTWFHTGAFMDRDTVLGHFAHEYYRNEQLAEHALPEPPLPDDLSALETREALRACRGAVLRREVYALDGTEREPHPYSVTQGSCRVTCVQPRRDGQSAVFRVTPEESIAYHYERDPADPRITHDLVLRTDPFGNVLRSASVAYPRQAAETALPGPVQQAQGRRTVACTVTAYTDPVDTPATYRLPASFESRGWEVTGAAPSAGAFFTAADLREALDDAEELGHEEEPTGGVQKRLLGHSRTYFLADDLATELPLGQRGALGLVRRTLRLAFTPSLLAELYDGRVSGALLAEGGYVHSEGDANWWAPTGTSVYPADAADHFFLPTGSRDPFGALMATVEYDPFDLLVQAAQDALGNRTEAVNDYRLLGPVRVTDANGDRGAIQADELGMVVRSAVMGREGAGEGDTLADPTVRMEYDLDRWRLQGRPNFVHTFARERHGAANPRWQESYAYADGGGGVVMTKVQAEPGIARRWNAALGAVEEVDTTPAVRWVGNGRTILNNKGNPVKQYEPYFSATPEFEDEAALVETGITSVTFYDPLGRAVRVERPDGTFSRVEFGPWRQASHDVNDTVLSSAWYVERGSPDPAGPEPADPEQRAAWLAARHAGTPAVTHADVLGRTVYAVADNGGGDLRAVRTETDLTGHATRVFDPRGREVAVARANLLGAAARAMSAEKGDRWILANVMGNTLRVWDGSERAFRMAYDTLHRPVSTFFRPAAGAEVLIAHQVYGEGHPDVEALRLRGRLYRVYDQAGMGAVEGYDFKGNPLRTERRLASDLEETVDWGALEGEAVAALDALSTPLLEGETWFSTATFDALSRPIEARLPDGTRVRPTYNEANVLETLQARIRDTGDWITFLENQDYDAKGQRLRAEFGNHTRTRYTYEPLTCRLSRLHTVRTGDAAVLQDLRYTYDPAGNLAEHRDDAQQTLFFDNAVVPPRSRFEYDPLYQLVRATGREHAGGGQPDHTDITLNPLRHANDAAAVRVYTEQYQYDELGNVLQMRHVAAGGSWTRHYRYAYEVDPADRTNRLVSTSLPGEDPAGPYSAPYVYDAYGNMRAMPHLASLTWSFADQLREVDLGGGGTAFYVYGGGGARMRKVVRRPGGLVQERIYMGGVEIYRERQDGALLLERQTVHVADNVGRIAQVDTKTVDVTGAAGLTVPMVRYVYGNHLGSATLETDGDGEPISYEEYHPFGTTAYRSGRSEIEVSLKRYRYIGRERDDETGLYQCGARYYAAWMGRWTSADPAGFADGLNLYCYCHNNPVRLADPNGMQSVNPRDVTVVQPQQFTGQESFSTLQGLQIPQGYQWDPRVTEQNFRDFWVPGRGPEGTGGTWAILVRAQTPAAPPPAAGPPAANAAPPGGGDAPASEAPAQSPSPGANASGEGGRTAHLGEAARQGVRAAATPRAATGPVGPTLRPGGSPFRPGQYLNGPYNLWSGGVDFSVHPPVASPTGGFSQAARSPGFVMEDTVFEQAAEAHARNRVRVSDRFAVPYGRGPAPSPEFSATWGPPSDRLAVRAGISQTPVVSHGLDTHPNPGRTVQVTREIPRIRGWGGAMAGLGAATGVLTIWGASHVQNDAVRGAGYVAGAAEIGGSGTYAVGLAMVGRSASSGAVMAAGRMIGGVAGGVGMAVLSTYAAVQDFRRGDYVAGGFDTAAAVGGVLIAAGTIAGAPLVVGAGAVLGVIALGFHLGRWGGLW
jgi:RHS repeat-associated protein